MCMPVLSLGIVMCCVPLLIGLCNFGISPKTNEVPLRNLSASISAIDRKSTRLNSSHLVISYAVFCLKKKICSSYHDWTDYELPPILHSMAALEILYIMEIFPMMKTDWCFRSPTPLHAMI